MIIKLQIKGSKSKFVINYIRILITHHSEDNINRY